MLDIETRENDNKEYLVFYPKKNNLDEQTGLIY